MGGIEGIIFGDSISPLYYNCDFKYLLKCLLPFGIFRLDNIRIRTHRNRKFYVKTFPHLFTLGETMYILNNVSVIQENRIQFSIYILSPCFQVTMIPIDQVNLKNTIYGGLDQIKTNNLSDHVTKMTLLKKFGGRKASRYVNDQERMRMDISVVQDSLNDTVNDSILKDSDDTDKVDNTKYFDRIRPPFNKDAETVSDIYKLSDVIPADLMERLEEEAKTVYQTQVDQIP